MNTFAAPRVNTHLRNNDNNVVSETSCHARTDDVAVVTCPHFIIHKLDMSDAPKTVDSESLSDTTFIKYHHKVRLNLTALPVSCPPRSEMDVLPQWTLQTDESLFRTNFHHDQESSKNRTHALRASFEKSAQRNKFCAVDPRRRAFHRGGQVGTRHEKHLRSIPPRTIDNRLGKIVLP